MTEKDIILALDIGTTNIKIAAIHVSGFIVRIEYEPLKLSMPQPGWVEICPHQLWEDVIGLFNIVTKGLETRILCVGITTQRSTFITWDRDTGEHLHNFITWMDMRTAQMCKDWNNRLSIRVCKFILGQLGSLVGSRHMKCVANFNINTLNVQMRFKWIMDNILKASVLNNQNKLSFGTIDTWIIYKLTSSRVWATDYTSAGATGIYDIWGNKWCPFMTWMFGNPLSSLPEVRDSNAFYGDICCDLGLSFTAPIYGVLGDQQASVLGNRLFHKGDVKLTLGTSLFCNVITDSYIHPVATDIYPQIAWKLKGHDICYMAETYAKCAAGKSLNWIIESGLLDKIENADEVAQSVPSSEGVCFTGLADFSDTANKSNFGLTGISSTTRIPHLVRSVMEFQIFTSMDMLHRMFNFYSKPDIIYVDGGISKSNFIVENICKLCETSAQKNSVKYGECSLMGAFYMAGLGVGIFKSFRDVENIDLQESSPLSFVGLDVSNIKNAYKRYTEHKF